MNSMTPHNKKRVAVIGGGISGLATAYRLMEESAQRSSPVDVVLFEADHRLGGVISTECADGFLLEGGPDSFISDKPWALTLARRIGLGDELIGTNPSFRRSFIVKGNRLVPVPEGFYLLAPSRLGPFVTTPIFSWAGKLRMGLDLVLPRRRDCSDSYDESLANFVRRRFGRETLERMAQPMVGGIYTADPEELSLRATMPRFLDWEMEYRSLILAMVQRRKKLQALLQEKASGPRYGLFVSFRKGMAQLVERLQSCLSADSIHLNSKIDFIQPRPAGKGWELRTDRGETFLADALCLALQAYQSAELLHPVAPRLADRLTQIKYASTATVNLAYRLEDIPHSLDGFGFVVPSIEKRDLLACTFCQVKFEGRAPGQFALLRAFMGGALQPHAFEFDDQEMLRAVMNNLKTLIGVQAEPLFHRIERHPLSMAQYRVGHMNLMNEVESLTSEHPGLQLAGNGYTGIGVPDCIHRGEECAGRILDYLNQSALQ
jgi:protoporphyrinogen/coproporphyrinogen III oxidase